VKEGVFTVAVVTLRHTNLPAGRSPQTYVSIWLKIPRNPACRVYLLAGRDATVLQGYFTPAYRQQV